MIIDSPTSNPSLDLKQKYDYCIIGAGAAGLYLAKRLTDTGATVIVLEAGGRQEDASLHNEFLPSFSNLLYAGATLGRSFQLGGTTAKWSGQLLPFCKYDQVSRPAHIASGFNHIISVCENRFDAVRSCLFERKLPDPNYLSFFQETSANSFHKTIESELGLKFLTSEWLPPSKRNLSWLIKENIEKSARSHVILNATFVQFNCKSSHSADGAVFMHRGERHTVCAQNYILCNGAIESTRALLGIAKHLDFPASDLGNGLSDHISMKIGTIASENSKLIIEHLAPIFQKERMRSFRLVPDDEFSETKYFFSFLLNYQANPAFQLINELIIAKQKGARPKIPLHLAMSSFAGFFHLAYSKLVHSKLYVPCQEDIAVHMDFEQTRSHANKITLSGTKNAHGIEQIDLSWKIDQLDVEKGYAKAKQFMEDWNALFPSSHIEPNELSGEESTKPFNVYHPVGTCRIGSDDRSVVDKEYRINGLKNAYVISSSILPTAGIANPTFALFCIAEDFVENEIVKSR